jgi:hypothetical protein
MWYVCVCFCLSVTSNCLCLFLNSIRLTQLIIVYMIIYVRSILNFLFILHFLYTIKKIVCRLGIISFSLLSMMKGYKKKNKFPPFFFLTQHDIVYWLLISFSFFLYTLFVCLTLPHSTQLAHSLRNISDYDTRWEERDGVLLYCHKGGRKGTTTEKKENIYIYKNPGIRLVVLSLFPRFFFSFLLLLATRNYS